MKVVGFTWHFGKAIPWFTYLEGTNQMPMYYIASESCAQARAVAAEQVGLQERFSDVLGAYDWHPG